MDFGSSAFWEALGQGGFLIVFLVLILRPFVMYLTRRDQSDDATITALTQLVGTLITKLDVTINTLTSTTSQIAETLSVLADTVKVKVGRLEQDSEGIRSRLDGIETKLQELLNETPTTRPIRVNVEQVIRNQEDSTD